MHMVLEIKRGMANSPSPSRTPSEMYFSECRATTTPTSCIYSLCHSLPLVFYFLAPHKISVSEKNRLQELHCKGLMDKFLSLPLNWFLLLTSQFLIMTAPHWIRLKILWLFPLPETLLLSSLLHPVNTILPLDSVHLLQEDLPDHLPGITSVLFITVSPTSNIVHGS